MAYRSHYDSAWKDALDVFFPQFLLLFWPDLHASIDWNRKPAFLDKELKSVPRSRARGRRYVDKLVSVHLRGQGLTLLLIHVEIQAGKTGDFAMRMYLYHAYLCSRYPGQPMTHLAVLLDGKGGAPQASYGHDAAGTQLRFEFPVAHLESWRARQDELLALAPANPFAVVILAQLEANATRDGAKRLAGKTALTRRLYHWGFGREHAIQLLRVLDGIIALPKEMEAIYEERLIRIEEETPMAYVSSIERIIMKRGREEGKTEGKIEGAAEVLAAQLIRKFGALPGWARGRLSQAGEAALNRWALQILDAQRIEDVFS
jgi:hypothetical protein